MDKLRYPIGQFAPILNPSTEQRNVVIEQIPAITITLKEISKNLNLEQLQTTYRPEGWTVQQVVHHLADNDMNAYLRFKRALTEEEPLSNSYREQLWAELSDYRETPIGTSIELLQCLHSRFYILLRNMTPADFNRTLRTQLLGVITIDTTLQRFVWHNRHHIAQIQSLIDRMGWRRLN